MLIFSVELILKSILSLSSFSYLTSTTTSQYEQLDSGTIILRELSEAPIKFKPSLEALFGMLFRSVPVVCAIHLERSVYVDMRTSYTRSKSSRTICVIMVHITWNLKIVSCQPPTNNESGVIERYVGFLFFWFLKKSSFRSLCLKILNSAWNMERLLPLQTKKLCKIEISQR